MESTVSPATLAAAFAEVADPRRAKSVVYPLRAILAMTVAALLAQCHSVLAIAGGGLTKRPTCWPPLAFRPPTRPASRPCSGSSPSSMAMPSGRC